MVLWTGGLFKWSKVTICKTVICRLLPDPCLSFRDKKMTPKLGDIERFVQDHSLEDVAFGYQHAVRVRENAVRLVKQYGGDEDIVIPSSLLHDVAFNWCNGQTHSIEGAKVARDILSESGYPLSTVDKICRAILLHEPMVWERYGSPETLEEKILFDADRTDLFCKKWIIKMAYIGSKNGIHLTRLLTMVKQIANDSFRRIHFDLTRSVCKSNFEFICTFIEDVEKEIA